VAPLGGSRVRRGAGAAHRHTYVRERRLAQGAADAQARLGVALAKQAAPEAEPLPTDPSAVLAAASRPPAELLECEVFLTMERKLPRNAAQIAAVVPLQVLRPPEYLALLRPWAALYL
jgi:hypothetical protein